MSRRKSPKASRKAPAAPSAEAQTQAQQLIQLYRGGRLQEALEGARAFTRRWPLLAVGWNVLGTAAQGLDQADDAVRAYRRAVELEPDNPGTRNNLGLMLARLEQFEEAARAFRAALRHKADFPEAAFNLAWALEGAGRDDRAEEQYRGLLQRHPRFAEAHNRLGNLLARSEHPDEAVDCYDAALALEPDNAGFLANRGTALAQQDRIEVAEAAYRQALALQPADLELHNNLGNLLKRRGHLAEAERIARAGLEQAAQRTDLLTQLAGTLQQLGRVDEAIELGRRALAAAPEQAEVQIALANALADGGLIEEADGLYRRALASCPHDAKGWYQLAILRRSPTPADDLAAVQAQRAKASGDGLEQAYLEYAAGKLQADRGDAPDAVFARYAAGARLRRATLAYDVAADEARCAAIADALPRARIEALAAAGHASTAPVFIVGMPRSGTSLIEQILASHPRVHGAGERRDWGTLVADHDARFGYAFPGWVGELDGDIVEALGRAYCAAVVGDGADADRVTDKMPGNFDCLGLIAASLPRARIVHVRREPADTCWSCFSYLFAGRQPFTYDLMELGRYYRAYDQLMAHWRAVLPGEQLLELRYEDLIADPEPQTRRLLAHCGLDWDPACLDFHRTERSVRTASANQVRQPLYNSAVGRWRAHAHDLHPLLDALGPLAPAHAGIGPSEIGATK
jgi:tetratricopeptide (TPR) repeat protein